MEMMQAMKDRFSKLTSSEKQLLPIINHVDLNMFGNLPLRSGCSVGGLCGHQ